MPDRVVRRRPEVKQRIVLFSQSGDLHRSEAERKQSSEIEIPQEFLRSLGRAGADFLPVIENAPE